MSFTLRLKKKSINAIMKIDRSQSLILIGIPGRNSEWDKLIGLGKA